MAVTTRNLSTGASRVRVRREVCPTNKQDGESICIEAGARSALRKQNKKVADAACQVQRTPLAGENDGRLLRDMRTLFAAV